MTEKRYTIDEIQRLTSQGDRNTIAMSGVIDMVSKFAITLSTTGVIWLVVGVADLKTDMATSSIEIANMKTQMLSLSDFTKIPRYTKDDAQRDIHPLIRRLDMHEEIIKERREWEVRINAAEQTTRDLLVRVSKLEDKK